MTTKDETQERLAEYKQLYAKIPGDDTTAKLDWMCENLHCSRTTARIWNTANTPRPMPAAKLKIMRKLLGA